MKPVKIKVKSRHSIFVALDNKHRVVAEGRTVKAVHGRAKKLGVPFSMMWIGERDKRYIFTARG